MYVCVCLYVMYVVCCIVWFGCMYVRMHVCRFILLASHPSVPVSESGATFFDEFRIQITEVRSASLQQIMPRRWTCDLYCNSDRQRIGLCSDGAIWWHATLQRRYQVCSGSGQHSPFPDTVRLELRCWGVRASVDCDCLLPHMSVTGEQDQWPSHFARNNRRCQVPYFIVFFSASNISLLRSYFAEISIWSSQIWMQISRRAPSTFLCWWRFSKEFFLAKNKPIWSSFISSVRVLSCLRFGMLLIDSLMCTSQHLRSHSTLLKN